MSSLRTVHLVPPHVTVDHIDQTITCIRAHRERIFRVDTEWHTHKLICNNYGQGGAGWTFLFGCVNESIRHYEHQKATTPSLQNKPITVVGAGCYGLLTAILLARKGHTVRIIAQDLEGLASYKAAGFFFPRPRKSSTPDECAVFQALGLESYKTLVEIATGNHPFISTGAHLLPAYFAPDIDPGFAPYHAAGLIARPQNVMIDFGNGKHYAAQEYTTIFINAQELMEELHRNRIQLHIPITIKKIETWDEIDDPVIFNCSGRGARSLSNDQRLIPVQGHLITLKNQPPRDQLQYMINAKVVQNTRGKIRDELIYYAPKQSGILGITFLRGQDSLTTNHHEFERLLQRCQDFFGSATGISWQS